MKLAQALFAPRAVALVGASGDAAKNTARPQRFLKKHGYPGRILPINPARAEVLGERAWTSLAEAPGEIGEIDHVFVMAPGEAVEQALEDCGKRGIPVMSIFTDGFADAGEAGMARQVRLVVRARELGVRILGPNSMGVVDVPGRTALTVNAVLEMDALPAGSTSVVSQSGTMLGTLLSRGAARGLGFAKLVSLGNEADIGAGELVDLLAEDADTQVILLFLETVRDAARLAGAARRAHAADKPVVAYKLGRSRSHTGALAGTDAALDAYFRDCGIVRVDMLETLLEIVPLVARRKPPDLERAARVAVVTTTGGGAASVVDRLGMFGIETVAPNSKSPIIDLTMAATAEQYTAVLDELLGCRLGVRTRGFELEAPGMYDARNLSLAVYCGPGAARHYLCVQTPDAGRQRRVRRRRRRSTRARFRLPSRGGGKPRARSAPAGSRWWGRGIAAGGRGGPSARPARPMRARPCPSRPRPSAVPRRRSRLAERSGGMPPSHRGRAVRCPLRRRRACTRSV